MKKALPNTKVTVKLRRSNYKEEWYLIIESYPVYKRGSKRASRVVESINRTISTPVWDKSSIARILPDGTFNYKPKRDLNGIIQCRSTIDQEACIYADNVRKLRQHEYDSAVLYTDKENEIAAQNERSEHVISMFDRYLCPSFQTLAFMSDNQDNITMVQSFSLIEILLHHLHLFPSSPCLSAFPVKHLFPVLEHRFPCSVPAEVRI